MFLVKKQNKTHYSSFLLPYFTADLLIMAFPGSLSLRSGTTHGTLNTIHLKTDDDTITEHTKTEQLKVQSTQNKTLYKICNIHLNTELDLITIRQY
jgi:hypothetical protein